MDRPRNGCRGKENKHIILTTILSNTFGHTQSDIHQSGELFLYIFRYLIGNLPFKSRLDQGVAMPLMFSEVKPSGH